MLNTVIHGDCLIEMQKIADKSVDMILCDLPYGTTACKWDTIIPFEPLWVQYKRIIKDNGAIVLTASQPFTTKLIASNFDMFKYEWVWDKKRITNPLLVNKQPLKQHENICIFYKAQPTYNPIKQLKNTLPMTDRLRKNYKTESTGSANYEILENHNEFGFPKSILTQIPVMNNLTKDRAGLHPTQKPVALFEYLIKTYTNENEIVLDNCAGSGTSAIACMNTNRNYILIEKEQKYIDIINNRIENHRNLFSKGA